MTDAAITAPLPGPLPGPLFGLRRQPLILLTLGLGLVVLLALFGEEDATAVQTWIDSTAYGHCFFVVPISLFLAWERRDVIAAMPLRPLPLLGLLAVPAGIVWFGAERLGLMEGQQLIVMALLQLLFLAALGWRFYRALSVPLLYLFFLVPSGAFVTGALQSFTADFIRVGLEMLGIPNIVDGNIIEIPEGKFFVAEACAGLRFLIAAIAFGVLYACMIYRSAGRRIIYIAVSVIVPIIANGFRGLGIVALGHVLGSAQAAAVDHVLYGWIFFSLVILLLILAGLPFRQDGTAPPVPASRPDSAGAARQMLTAVALVVGLSAIAPITAAWIERQPAPPLSLNDAVGCLPQPTPEPATSGARAWLFNCPISAGNVSRLELRVDALPPHGNSGAVVRARRRVTFELNSEDATTRTIVDRPDMLWQLVTTIEPDHMTALSAWSDGNAVRGGWAQRVARAVGGMNAAAGTPILLTLTTPAEIVHLSPAQQFTIGRAMEAILQRNTAFIADLAQLSRAPQP